VHTVRLAIFGALFWKRPGPLLKIELIPGCLRHFSALPGEGQELHDAAIGTAYFPSRPDHLREFDIVQDSVSRMLSAGQWHTLRGRLFENCPSYTPLEKRFDRFEGLIRCRWRSTFVNGGDELDNFSFADVMDAPMAPDVADLTPQQPRDFSCRAIARHVLCNVSLKHVSYAIGYFAHPSFPLLAGRIAAF
jgi:hypothetical protein